MALKCLSQRSLFQAGTKPPEYLDLLGVFCDFLRDQRFFKLLRVCEPLGLGKGFCASVFELLLGGVCRCFSAELALGCDAHHCEHAPKHYTATPHCMDISMAKIGGLSFWHALIKRQWMGVAGWVWL